MPGPPSILHIDDSASDLLLVGRAFAHSGLRARLHSVSGASEALRFLNKLDTYRDMPTPRLILLDLGLPRVDGRQLLAALKNTTAFRGQAIVVLTGSDTAADRLLCGDLRVDEYLVKPTVFEDLVALISGLGRWLERRPTTHWVRKPRRRLVL